MSRVQNTEFKEALREIAQRVPHFNSPYGNSSIVVGTLSKSTNRIVGTSRHFRRTVPNEGPTLEPTFFVGIVDRVRIVEWCRRLAGLLEDTVEESRKRNDYVQLLKIMTRGGRLHGLFLKKPPDNEIPPLSEAMANALCEQCPCLPRPGPIEPVVSRQTPDGCAYIAFRKLPNKGILCYMAVSPEGLKAESEASFRANDGEESGEDKGEDEDKDAVGDDEGEDECENEREDDRETRFIRKN